MVDKVINLEEYRRARARQQAQASQLRRLCARIWTWIPRWRWRAAAPPPDRRAHRN